MKTTDKLALGALGVILITNPASGQAVLVLLEMGFKLIFQYASPINFLASGVLIAYVLYKIWDGRETVKVPAKTKATKKQQYVTT